LSATVSLLGLSRTNPGILGGLVLPDGLDADLVKDNLLAETAELEVIYPDAVFMQAMIGRWSQKELPIWTRLYKTTLLDYNPIENYDRTEEWTEGENSARSVDAETTGNSTTDSTGSTNASGTTTASDTGQKFVSAYNETDFTPIEKDTDTQTGSSDTEQREEGNVKVKTTADTTTNETEKRDLVRSGRAHGNIGVTTSQQMIESEREVSLYNIIDVIITSFKNRFCLQIY
jgi:hypothetical protein